MEKRQKKPLPSPKLVAHTPSQVSIENAGAFSLNLHEGIQDRPGQSEREARSTPMASFLIPGRPHTKFGTRQGNAYFAHVKEAAQETLERKTPLCAKGFITVTLDLYFAANEDAPKYFEMQPELWDSYKIPRADAAAGVLLSALKGLLYASSRQVQPLTVNRFVKSKDFLETTFGSESKRGCAVVHYAPSVFDLACEQALLY